MSSYLDEARRIPWHSAGRETKFYNVGKSLVPVGVLPFDARPIAETGLKFKTNEDPDREQYLIDIAGTAIQAGDGKLVTCGHVAEDLVKSGSYGHILARLLRDGLLVNTPYPISNVLRYIDPRTNAVNHDVDLSVLISRAISTEELPYEVPNVAWGESADLGVGDDVLVAGYPHGTDMFKFTASNRGIIQPTFYAGVVSAILPATNAKETRILQISVPSAGGMSGGAVIDKETGKVVGMITSCVHTNGIPQPISYALPSEIIAPFVNAINFGQKDSE